MKGDGIANAPGFGFIGLAGTWDQQDTNIKYQLTSSFCLLVGTDLIPEKETG